MANCKLCGREITGEFAEIPNPECCDLCFDRLDRKFRSVFEKLVDEQMRLAYEEMDQ